MQIYERELDKAARIRRIELAEVIEKSERLYRNPDVIQTMRKQMKERCGLHGGAASMSSKMLSIIDILLEHVEENN